MARRHYGRVRMTDSSLPKFQREQFAFTAHLRDPDKVSKPDAIEDRRMNIYRELLFNNVCGFLDNGFPVLKSLYQTDDWLRLSRRFFADHRSHSPYFVDIPEAFVAFLQQEYQPLESDPPFLLELAHYEWLELVVMTSTDEPDWSLVDRHGSLTDGIPVLSPLAMCQGYQWPVHTIAAENVPDEPLPQPVFMIVYRNAEGAVKFIEANPVTARLFELIQGNKAQHTGQQLLTQIAEELQHPNPDMVMQGGLQTLTRWHHLQIVLGVVT